MEVFRKIRRAYKIWQHKRRWIKWAKRNDVTVSFAVLDTKEMDIAGPIFGTFRRLDEKTAWLDEMADYDDELYEVKREVARTISDTELGDNDDP